VRIAMPFTPPPPFVMKLDTPTEDRPIKKVMSIGTSKYQISDGTEFTVRPVVLSVRRVKNQFNELGQPLYIVNIANSIDTKAPAKLMKKKG